MADTLQRPLLRGRSRRPVLTAAGPLTSAEQAQAARDRTEDQLAEVISRAMRKYLARVEKALRVRVRGGGPVLTGTTLTAAGWDDPLTLGDLAGWWIQTVNSQITADILAIWAAAYAQSTGTGVVTESAMRHAVEEYLPRVTDRLVRGIIPPVAEDSFDKARIILARSTADGWTRKQTAARIALEFGWETNGPGWREQLDDVNARIDAILEPLGHPGNPAREYTRLHDPTVAALQEDRAQIIQGLDAEQTYWQHRADLIARTESTSLHGYAANRALAAEGFTHKKWVATNDARTREEHREVNGDVVAVDAEFVVGGFLMQYPGDPAAPVAMIANCRCTLIGADQVETPAGIDTGDTGPAEPPGRVRAAAELNQQELEAEISRLMADPDGFDDPRMEQLVYELDKRDTAQQASRAAQEEETARAAYGRVWRRPGGEKALRDEYDTWIEVQYLAAEQELNGALLSPEGKRLQARGELDIRDLFTRRRRSLKYLSPELEEWFSRNPRMSFPEFRAGATLDDVGRAARRRSANRGWEGEFG